jgi:hypothetical protein
VDQFAQFGNAEAIKGGAAYPGLAVWRDSHSVCALADDRRHVGHIVRAGNCWLAFDATHANETGTGFRLVGCWQDVAAAKRAVEQVFSRAQAADLGLSRLN